MLETECPVDLLCFSHLRWDHVYQRPNHLMSRAAAAYRVWFVEEPVEAGSGERIEVDEVAPGVRRVRFVVPCAATDAATAPLLRRLMDQFLHDRRIGRPILWYYSPLALAYSEHVEARAVVYDCMDELSAFMRAPPEHLEYEARLFGIADVCFTGDGASSRRSASATRTSTSSRAASTSTTSAERDRRFPSRPTRRASAGHDSATWAPSTSASTSTSSLASPRRAPTGGS